MREPGQQADQRATLTLRSVAWDGLPPAVGDVVRLHADGGTLACVTDVAQGPGVGQWRITCEPARVIEWRQATWLT